MILASWRSSIALGADPPCARVTLATRAELSESWQEAVASLRETIAGLSPAECAPLRIEIAEEGGGARVIVSSLDGRSGERYVAKTSSLTVTALGLIASIPSEPAASVPTRAVDPEEKLTSAAPTAAPVAAPAPRSGDKPFGLQLAAAVGARVGFPTSVFMADVEARADVRVRGWFVLGTVRYAPLGAQLARRIDGYTYDEVALALGVGRRIVLGGSALDLAVAPTLAIATEEGNTPADGTGGTASAVRVNASARLIFGVGTRFQPALTIDTEVAPGSLSAPMRVDEALPALPSWTVGLRAGAAGDLL